MSLQDTTSQTSSSVPHWEKFISKQRDIFALSIKEKWPLLNDSTQNSISELCSIILTQEILNGLINTDSSTLSKRYPGSGYNER